MKCPNCGQWNQASLPRCFKCGTPLMAPDDTPAWKSELKDNGPAKVYLQVDEDGDVLAQADRRDVLAHEMDQLKARIQEGERVQRRLREEGARRGYAPSSLTVRSHTTRETFFSVNDDPNQTLRQSALGDSAAPENSNGPRVYGDPRDTRSYESLWDERATQSMQYTRPQDITFRHKPVRRMGFRRILRVLIILVCIALVVFGGLLAYNYFRNRSDAAKAARQATVISSTMDGMPAHTIFIPGNEGDQIYIWELGTTHPVTGGVATVQAVDHSWYDSYEEYLQETMTVTLSPYKKLPNGQMEPLDPVVYDISIPLSPLTLVTPDVHRVDVSTAMYSIKFTVQPNSTVTVNGEDLSDMVKLEGGDVTYNATVQPIGDNVFTIKVRSQYCRETTEEIIIYRAPQEIPLDLASDTYTTSSSNKMTVNATTLPGAIVNVLSPHSDLDITNVDSSGEFSFIAEFTRIGTNTITITADFPGKAQSIVKYDVYYVPTADVYTPKAWPMDTANYTELLSNNAVRVARTQIYVCNGTIEYIVSDKPQLAVINAEDPSNPGRTHPVLLENNTKTTWVVGKRYSIYADAYGTYNDMPRLAARYTYTLNDK